MKRLLIIGLVSILLLTSLPLGIVRATESIDTSLSSIDYEGINNEFIPAVAPWDWQMADAPYSVKVVEDFTAGQILEFEVDGSIVRLQPMALEWTNDYDMIQQVSMPQDVNAVVTNPDSQGTITWDNAYGSNIDFEWECTPNRLNKILTISGLNDLSPPAQYIQDGGNPVLRLNLIFDPSSDVDIYVNGSLWDKSSKQQTFDIIEFRKNGEILWNFAPLMYWDSAGNEGQSIATLEKRGQSLYISIRVPYEWLQSAVYPVFIDADILIEGAADDSLDARAIRGGVFWTSPIVGYVIFLDINTDLVYRKTANGGATWGAAQVVVAPASCNAIAYDCYADWQTADDAGTKIHIVYVSADLNEIRYVYLDTSDDSVGGDDLIETCQGTGTFYGVLNFSFNMGSITKTRGGNLAVAVKYTDNAPAFHQSFYTSPDAATWTEKTNPFEDRADFCLVYPGNEADSQDLWVIYWDADADAISLKTFDNSGNSWSEQAIAGSMADNANFLQIDGTIRLSDGHLIFAAWNLYDNANADLMVWDINGAGSITAKTNVLTDSAESFLVSVFINQDNDDIYVAYMKGTTVGDAVAAFYQLSQDGGANWDGQTAMQADAEDDEKWISCGAMKKEWGGKFQPVWFDDDDNDIFTNTDNGISIAGPALPTVTTDAADDLEDTTATLNGTVTDDGGETVDYYGFVWDTGADQGDPGDVDPSGPPGTWDFGWKSNVGDYGENPFDHAITGLPTGTVIHFRATAHNVNGWAYGAADSFLTKPAAPTNVAATSNIEAHVTIIWTASVGATDYHVWRDAVDLGASGDVETEDDVGATVGTITNAGTATATDGSIAAHVELSLAGEATGVTEHVYKVVASNATGNSDDSLTDNGNRAVGAITYAWQVSDADLDAAFNPIGGGTTDPYEYAGAPANGDGRWYYCIVSSTGASNSPQDSTHDRGFRGTLPIVFTYNAVVSGLDAILNGEMTATGGQIIDYRGFVWGYTSFGDPGDTAPGATGYDYNWTESGSFPIGAFDHEATLETALSLYFVRACAHSVLGWAYGDEVTFFTGEADKVYLEFRPDLDETRIRGNAGIPTGIRIGEPGEGLFTGYSLPIWNEDDEELYFLHCVPDRWDGESHIIIHIITALANANEAGNSYQLQVEWEQVTPNVEEVPVTLNTTTFTRTTESNTQFECYRDYFIVLYNADVGDDIEVDDELAIRLRRIAAGGQLKELDGELIILHWSILFARGDLLGDPEGSILTIILNLIEEGILIGGEFVILLALGLIAVILMVAAFCLKRQVLAIGSAFAWLVFAGAAYIESAGDATTAAYWIFWFGIAMSIAMALEAVLVQRSAKKIREEETAIATLSKEYEHPADRIRREHGLPPSEARKRRKTRQREKDTGWD